MSAPQKNQIRFCCVLTRRFSGDNVRLAIFVGPKIPGFPHLQAVGIAFRDCFSQSEPVGVVTQLRPSNDNGRDGQG